MDHIVFVQQQFHLIQEDKSFDITEEGRGLKV